MAEQGIKEIKIDNIQYLIEPTIYTAISQTSASATFTAALTNFQLFDGALVAVKFNATNNANATLNINSTGAKPIYYNNAEITANQLKANHTYTLSYVQSLNSNNGGWELIGDLDTNKYHKSGSWSDLTYTATAVNNADELKFTIPDNYGDTKNPYASKTKNYVLAAPSDANGVPSFRALVEADIPEISNSKLTNSSLTIGASSVSLGETLSTINGPLSIKTSGDKEKAFIINRNGPGEATSFWQDDSFLHIDVVNDEITAQIRFELKATDLENSDGSRNQTSYITFNGANSKSKITADYFSGNGSSLTNLNASNIKSGTIPSAQLPIATSDIFGAVKTGSGITNTNGVIELDTSGSWNGNAATATKLSNTPNNNTTFLRGDNTWSNTLFGSLYIGNLASTDSNLISAQSNSGHITLYSTGYSSGTYGARGLGVPARKNSQNEDVPWKDIITIDDNNNAIFYGTTYNSPTGSALRLNSGSGGSIIFQQNGINKIRLDQSGILRPETNGYSSLGNSNYKWNEIYANNIYGLLTIDHTAGSNQELRIKYNNTIDYWLGIGNDNVTYGLYDNKLNSGNWILSAGANNTWTLNGNAATATADENGYNLSDHYAKKYVQTVDLTNLSTNTWYPVSVVVPQDGMHRISCVTQLNGGNKPSWASHEAGFTAVVEMLVLAGDWGTTTANTICLCNDQKHINTNEQVPIGYSQFVNSSRAAFWCRGGAKYRLLTDFFQEWGIHTESYTFSNQTIAPTTTYPGFNFIYSRITADLDGNAATVSRATFGDASNAEHNANNIVSNGLYYYQQNGPSTTTNLFKSTDGAMYCQAYNTGQVAQIAQDYRNGALAVRGKNSNVWQEWLSVPLMKNDTYPSLLSSDGASNWIKIGISGSNSGLGFGLLPCQSGNAGSGHGYLGTSTWYWKQAYIDEIRTGNVYGTGASSFKTINLWPQDLTNYCEGIRIHSSNQGWCALMLCGSDNTADVGTSANSWGIFTYSGTLYINKGASNAETTSRVYADSNGWHFTKAYGAVWNDYAEFRKTNKEARAGQVVIDNDDGSLSITNKRLMSGAQIVSDTFGFSIGESEEAKTPLAVSGRVLVYTYRPREEYHAGMAVCSAPNGTIDIMTREEIQQYPDAIIGIVSEIPDYEEWGTGKVKVDGRIWIKIK